MFCSRYRSCWLLVLTGVVMAIAGCVTQRNITLEEHSGITATPEEYNGTIYYEDGGIWKIELPSKQSSCLTAELIDAYDLSPTEEWLSYVKYSFDGDQKLRSVWVVSAQGGSPIQVSRELSWAGMAWLDSGLLRYTECPDFHFSEDGKPVGFESCTSYTFDPETGNHNPSPPLERQIVDDTLRCGTSWAPGRYGDMAEWCLDETYIGFLRVVKFDGSNPITVALPYRTGEAQWSDDGAKLAFTNSYPDGTREQLFIWNRSDGSVNQVVDAEACGGLSWSPDKQWIAFYAGGNDFCVVEVSTESVTCFEGYISSVGPKLAWSPNSRAIVLSSNRIGQLLMGDTELVWDLFIVSIPDGNVTRVTDSAEVESLPLWGH